MAQVNQLKQRLQGIYSILLTPFTADLKLDLGAAAANIEYLLSRGVHGFVIAGTYGEYVTMDADERQALVETAVRTVGRRVPVIACTAGGSTPEVAEHTRRAAAAGADAAMITPPYGMLEPTERDIIGHFVAVARQSEIGLLLYNNPNITPSLAPGLIARLADIDGYVGIKQGAVTIQEHAELLSLAAGKLRIFCGSDQAMVAALALGVDGVSSTQSNFMPDIIVDTYAAMQQGDLAAARAHFARWAEFRRFARTAGQPAAAKAAVELLGRPCGPVRPPLTPLDGAQREELRAILGRMGLEVPA